jgi:hypothetical protein
MAFAQRTRCWRSCTQDAQTFDVLFRWKLA